MVESGGAVGLRRGDIWKGQRPGWQGRPGATAKQSYRIRACYGTTQKYVKLPDNGDDTLSRTN